MMRDPHRRSPESSRRRRRERRDSREQFAGDTVSSMPGPSAQYSPQPPQPYTPYPPAPTYPQSHYSQVPPGPRYPDAESYASRPEHYDDSRTYVDPRYHQPERYAPNDSYAGPQGSASASAEPSRYGESQDYRQTERTRPRGSSSASSSSSTSSSFLNISAKSPRFGGVFSTFFRAPSEQRKKRRRKKQMARILSFGNSSSSSVNSDLAYGRGYIERDKSQGPTPKPSAHPSPAMYRSEPVEPRQQPPAPAPAPAPAPRSKTDEEILEIGRQLQDIARRQNDADLRAAGKSRTSQLAGAAAAAAAISHFSRKSKSNSKARGTGTSKPSDLGSSSDDDWESASDDDSSEDSSDGGLAYGSAFKPSKSARISSEPPEQIKPPERKSTVVDPRLFGPYNSLRGAVKSPCGFGEEDPRSAGSSRRHHEETVAQVESPKVTGKEPMQRVYPVPTSDPDRFDFDRSSMTSSRQGLPQQSRPAPVPLQQPIPIVPVSSKVYDAERFVEEEPRGPRKPYQPSNGRSAAETAIAGVGVAAAAIGAAMASNRRDSVEYLERRDDRPSELRDRRGDNRESRDVRIAEERADRPARIELEDREVPNRHGSRRSTRHSEVVVVDDRGKRHAARDDISRESLKRQASTGSHPEVYRLPQGDEIRVEYDKKEDYRRREEPAEQRIEDREPLIEDRKPRIEDRQPRIEDRKPEVIEERQHAERTEKPSESTRHFHGVEQPEAPITQAPIDPFQFQVADDAFQTPKYATPKTATPKRPLTPQVVTVDREPNFDDSPPRKPDYSDSRMSRKDSFELERRLEQYQQGFRDRSRTPESRHRSHSLEEQEHAAKSIYDEAKHATAPVDAAAFASAIAVEQERSKRHRNDHVTEDGSRDRSRTARDTVQEEADKYYRETILARKIAADEIRSRSASPHDKSIVGKWDDHEAPEIVTIRTPPELDHPHDKSPYDAPDADVRIDNVIIPEELNRFLLADGPFTRGAVSIFRSRDPSCERDRPLLNLVLPTPEVTPRPTPAPEKQREIKPADESRESTDSRPVGADAPSVDSARHPEVILGPTGEVIERPTTPTAKSVTWGENETKSFEVESPEPPRNGSSGSSPKSTKSAKSKKRLGKSSPWGIIAAAIGGSGAAAATAAPEVRDPFQARNDDDKQQKTGEDEEKHSPPQSPKSRAVEPSSPVVVAASPKLVTSFDDDLPPAPGPKPSSPRMPQMPGTFADDLEFASVLAAGLQDSGFDPNIVIDNPAYIRRDSPPGQNEPALYQQPFAETVTDLGIYPPDHVRHSSPVRESGYVIGEVPETPEAEKHVHDDDTSHFSLPREYRDKGKAREIPVADEEHITDASEPARKLSKKEKRKQKAAKRQSLDDVSGDFTSDIPEAPFQPPAAPYSRVVPDYDRHYSYADRSQSPETVVAIDTKSRSLDDSSSGNRPPSPDGPSVARPTTSEAASAEWETPAPTKVSKKQKKKNRASKSDVILVQEYDERPQEEFRAESRNSRAEPPESPAHVSTDPPETGDDTRSTPAKKKKSKKSKQSSDEWTDVEKQIDDTPTSERSRSAAAFDDWDDRPAKSRRDRTKSEDRDVSSVVSDPASRRDKERSDRRSNGTRYEDGDDVKSVASDGTSRSKRRSRDEKKSSKDDEKRSSGSFFSLFRPSGGTSKDTSGKDEKSFLDNAGTLGAGAGLASAMAALGSMMSRSNAIEPQPEESSDVLSLRERSASPSRDVDILDPEITQRAIRPAIDPQYGDLLPLPPSPMPPSSPGSPTQELEELPALPDSRPETPPDERRRQHEMKTHVRRRSNLETPTKSPSQTAIPLKLRLGQRSTPSSPGNIGHAISPGSPPTVPAVPETALAKRPSRPISWESSREIKPLYLLEHARQEHAAQLPELPIDFPELPPSEPSSRESPAPEFALPQDDVSCFNQLQASPFEHDLRINTEVYHFPPPNGHYGSQETTPKAEQASQHTVAVLGPPSPALPVAPKAARQMNLFERELIDLPALPASPVAEPNPADLPALPSSPLTEYDISDSPAVPASTVDELASLPVLPSSLPTEREIMDLPALPESPVTEDEPESMPNFPVVPNGTMDELGDLPIPPSSPPTETMDLPALPDSPGTGYGPESMPALPAVPTGIMDELVRLPLALSSPPTEAMDLLPPLPESPGTGYEPESMPALPAVPADTLVELADLPLPPFVPLTEREVMDLPALPDSPVIGHQPEDMPALPVDPLVEHDLAYLPAVSWSAVDEHTQPDLPLLDASSTAERVVEDVADDPIIPTTPQAEKELPTSSSFKPESPALPTLADAMENINFFGHELEYLPALPASPLTELGPAELPLGTVFGPESPALPSLPDAAQLDVIEHELGDLPALPASPEIFPIILSEPPAALPTSIMFGPESPAPPTLPDAAQLEVSKHELEDLPALPASPEITPAITSEPPADLPPSTVYGPESPALPTLSNAAKQLEGFEHELGHLPALPASPEIIPTITSQPPTDLPPSTVYGPESPALPTLANAAKQLEGFEHELGHLPALPASPEITPIITAEPDLVEAISKDRSSYLQHKTPPSIIKNLIEHDLPDTPPSPTPSKPQEVTDVIPELEEKPQPADPEVAVDELARAAVADLAAEVPSGVEIVEGQPAEVEPETRTLEAPEPSEPPAESKKSKKAKKKKNKRLSTQNSTVPPLDTASSSTPQEKDENPLPTEAVPSSRIDKEQLFSSVATAEPSAEEPLPPSTKEDIPSISTNQEESPLPQDVALPVTPTQDVSHSADLDRVLSLDTTETGSAAHADSSFAGVVLPAFGDYARTETIPGKKAEPVASTEDPTAIPLPSDDEDEFTQKPAALVLAPDEAQISSADLPRLAPDNGHATILAEAAHPKTSADDTDKGPESIPSAPSDDKALPQDDYQAEDNATIVDTAGPIAAATEPDVPETIVEEPVAEEPVAEKKLSKKERKKLKKAQAQAMLINESADTADKNSKPSDNEALLPSTVADAPLVIPGAPAAPSADTEPVGASPDDTKTNFPTDIGVPDSAPEPEAEGPSEAAVSSTDQQVATSFDPEAFAVLADAEEPVSSRGAEQEVDDKIAEQSEAPPADEFPEPESKKSKKKKKKGRKALDAEAEVISSLATAEASGISSQPVPAAPEQEQEPTGIDETPAMPKQDPESTVHASQEAGNSLDAEKVQTVSTPGPDENSAEVDNSAANQKSSVNESANESAGLDDLPPEPREANVGKQMLPLPEDDLSDSAVTALIQEGQTANTDGLLVLDQPPSITAEETNRVNVDENVVQQQPPPPEQEEIPAHPDETLQAQQPSVPESDQTTREAAPATIENMAPADEPSSPMSKKQKKKKGKKNQATEDKTPALTDSKPAEGKSVSLKPEEEKNHVHSTEDVHVEPVSESVTDTLTPVLTVKDVHEEASGSQPKPAEAETSIARGTEEATAASALTAPQLSDDLPPSLVEGDNTISEPAPADTEPPAETPLPEPSGKKKKKKRKSKGAASLSQLDDFISVDTTPTQTPASETPPAVDTSAADQSTVDTPTVDKLEVETPAVDISAADIPSAEILEVDTPAADIPAIDTPEVEASAVDTSAVVDASADVSAVDTPAVDTPAVDTPAADTSATDASVVETSAADTVAVETSPIETSTVQTSTINTTTVDTPEVDTSAVDTSVVDTSVAETPAVKSPPDVDNSAIDPSAVETPAIKTPAVETPPIDPSVIDPSAVETPAIETLTEPSTTETPVAETPAEIPFVETLAGETPAEIPVVETPTEIPSIETPTETPVVETLSVETPAKTLAVETPAVETPTETSVIETPVVETPVVETPAVETPAEIPVAKTPAADTPTETLAVETPIEIPVVETRSIETPTENTVAETPADETPAEISVVETPTEISMVETPAEISVVETPAETPAIETPAIETPAVETPAVETPADVVETPTETPAVETQAETTAETPVVEILAVETSADTSAETPAQIPADISAEIPTDIRTIETPVETSAGTPAVETPTEASNPTPKQDAEDTRKQHEADIEKHGDTARTPEVPVTPSTDPAVGVDSVIPPAEESSKSSKKSKKKKKKNRLSVADSETATPVADDSPATAVPVSSHDTAPNDTISGGEKSIAQDPDVTEDQAQRQDITSPEHTKLEDGPSATNNEAGDPTPAEGQDEAFVTPPQGPIVINDGEEAPASLSREPTLVESQTDADAAAAEKPAAENQESTVVEVPTDLETMPPASSKKSKKKGKKAAALEAEVDETSRDLDGTEEAKDETTESRTDTTSDKTGEMAQASQEPHASGEFATDSKISEEADPGPAVTKKGKKKKKGKKSSTLDPEPENSPSSSTLETTADVANTMDKSAYIISPRGEPGSDEFPLPQADASTEAAWPTAANAGKKRKSVTWAPELESFAHGSELPRQDGDDKALESASALEQQPTMEHSQTRDQPQAESPQPTGEEESGSETPPATTDVDQAATPVAEKDVDLDGQTPASELGDRTLPRPHDIHPSDYYFPSPAGLNRRGFGRGYFPSAHRMLLAGSSSSASDADVANRKGGETLQQMAGSEADATLDAEHAGRAHAIDKPHDAPANTDAQTGEVGVTDPGLHADVESVSGVECDKSLQDTPNGRTADAQSVGPALTDSALEAGDPLNTPVQALANQDTNPEMPLQALDLAPSPSPSPISPQVVKKSDAGYTDTAETRSGEDNDNDTPGPSLQKPEHCEEKPQEKEKDGSSPSPLATDAPVPARLETSESPGEPIAAEPHLLESPLETLPHLGLGPAGVPTKAAQSPDQTENEPGPGAGSIKMSKKDKKKAKKAAALSAAQDDDVQDTAAPGGNDEALAVQSIDSAPAPAPAREPERTDPDLKAEVSAAPKAVPVTDLVEAWAGEDAWAIQPKKSKKDKKKRAAAALAEAAAAVVAAKSKEPALEDPKEGAAEPDQPSSTFPPGDTDTDNKVVQNENQLAETTPAGTSQLSAQDVKTLEPEDTPQPLSEPTITTTADPEPTQTDTQPFSSETPEMAPSADATATDGPPLTQELLNSPRETDPSSQPTSETIVDTPSALPEEEYPVVTKRSKKDKKKKKDASFQVPEQQDVVTNAQDLPKPSSVEKAGDATPSPDIVDASGPREETVPDAVVTTDNTRTLQQETPQDVAEQKSVDEAPAEENLADEKLTEEPTLEHPAREQIVEKLTGEEEYAAISKKTKKDKKKKKAATSSEESPALAVAEPDVTPVLVTSPESPNPESLETTTNEKPTGSDGPVEQTTADSEQVPAHEDLPKESTVQALDDNDAPQPETPVDPEDEFPAVRKKSKKDGKKGKRSQADSVAEPLSQPASQNEPEVQSSEAAFTEPVPSASLPVPEGVSADRDPTVENLPISGEKTDDQDVAKDPTDVEAVKPRNSDDLSAREENPNEKEKQKGSMTELESEMRALPSSSTESAIDSAVPPASASAPFAEQPLNEMIVPTAGFQPNVSTPQDADVEEEFPLTGKKAKKSKTKKNEALELTEPETEPQRTVEPGTEPSSETKSDAASPAERTIEQPSGTDMPVDSAEQSAEQPEAVTQSDKTTTTDTVQEVENPSQDIAATGPTSGSEEAMTVNTQQGAEVGRQARPAVDNEPSEPKLSKKDKKKKKAAKLQDDFHPDSGTATPKTLEIPEDPTPDSQGASKNDGIPSSDIIQIADAISSNAQAPPTDGIAAMVETPEVNFMPFDNPKDQEHSSLPPKNLQEESQVPEPTAPSAETEAPITTKRSKKDKKKKKGKSVDESAISWEMPQPQPAEREEQSISHVASVEDTPVVDKKDTDSLNAEVPGEALSDDSVKAPFQPSIEPFVEPSVEPPVEPSVEPPVEPSVEPPFDFSTETNVNNSDSVCEKSMSTKSEGKKESGTEKDLGVNTGTSDPLEGSHLQANDSNKPQDTLDQITLPIDSTMESPPAVSDNTIPKTATPDTGESQPPTMPLQDDEWTLPTKTSKKDKKKKKSRAKNDLEEDVGSAMPLEIPAELPKENATPVEDTTTAEEVKVHTDTAVQKPFLPETGSSEEPHTTTPGGSTSQHPSERETDEREPTKTVPQPVQAEPENTTEEDVIIDQPQECMVRNPKMQGGVFTNTKEPSTPALEPTPEELNKPGSNTDALLPRALSPQPVQPPTETIADTIDKDQRADSPKNETEDSTQTSQKELATLPAAAGSTSEVPVTTIEEWPEVATTKRSKKDKKKKTKNQILALQDTEAHLTFDSGTVTPKLTETEPHEIQDPAAKTPEIVAPQHTAFEPASDLGREKSLGEPTLVEKGEPITPPEFTESPAVFHPSEELGGLATNATTANDQEPMEEVTAMTESAYPPEYTAPPHGTILSTEAPADPVLPNAPIHTDRGVGRDLDMPVEHNDAEKSRDVFNAETSKEEEKKRASQVKSDDVAVSDTTDLSPFVPFSEQTGPSEVKGQATDGPLDTTPSANFEVTDELKKDKTQSDESPAAAESQEVVFPQQTTETLAAGFQDTDTTESRPVSQPSPPERRSVSVDSENAGQNASPSLNAVRELTSMLASEADIQPIVGDDEWDIPVTKKSKKGKKGKKQTKSTDLRSPLGIGPPSAPQDPVEPTPESSQPQNMVDDAGYFDNAVLDSRSPSAPPPPEPAGTNLIPAGHVTQLQDQPPYSTSPRDNPDQEGPIPETDIIVSQQLLQQGSPRNVAASYVEHQNSQQSDDVPQPMDPDEQQKETDISTIEAAAGAAVVAVGAALVASKSTTGKKKGSKSENADKRALQKDDVFDDPSLWERADRKHVSEPASAEVDSFGGGDDVDTKQKGPEQSFDRGVIDVESLDVAASDKPDKPTRPRQRDNDDVFGPTKTTEDDSTKNIISLTAPLKDKSKEDNVESPILGRELDVEATKTQSVTKEDRSLGPQVETPPENLANDIDEAVDRGYEIESHYDTHGGMTAISPDRTFDAVGFRSPVPSLLPPVQEEETDTQPRTLPRTTSRGALRTPELDRDGGFRMGSPHPFRTGFISPEGDRGSVVSQDWQETTTPSGRDAQRTPEPLNYRERRRSREAERAKSPAVREVLRRSPFAEWETRDLPTSKTPVLLEPNAREPTPEPHKHRRISPELERKRSKYQDLASAALAGAAISSTSTPRSTPPPGSRSISERVARIQSPVPTEPIAARRSMSNSSLSRHRRAMGTPTPEPLKFRPESPGISRPSTATPPLRRVDRRVSGDLRSLSQRSQQDLSKDLASSSDTPVANEGRVRTKDMADVYDGFGEGRIGSPRSPTRPHSMRRRQSMQVLELESRVEQLMAENRMLADARTHAESHNDKRTSGILAERDAEIDVLKQSLEFLQKEVARLTEVNEGLNSANTQLAAQHNERYRSLETQHADASRQLEEARTEKDHFQESLLQKDAEIGRLRSELDAAKEKIRQMQRQILATKGADADFLNVKDVDHFDHRCQQLCSHVQQWVLRFSKFSDMRACRLTNEINDEKVIDRLDNAILDGTDVDAYLADRVKRRDVFMSMTMNMIWEFVFTRYLFGMDREQRQKLKSLEKLLTEVGPSQAVRQWRAVTLTLLSKRPSFKHQRDLDTEAVVQAIFQTLSKVLPPPSNLEDQIQSQLRRVMREAVDLSVEMRTQRAEYMMLPPLQPEYDADGELAETVTFNAALMNERSGDKSITNEALEAQRAVVRVVLFPLVVKKGDDAGNDDDEIVVCPAQVLVARPKGKSVRLFTPGSDAGETSLGANTAAAHSDISMGTFLPELASNR